MVSAKKLVERVLRKHPPLFAMASKLYYSVNTSFQTLSPGAPAAIYEALKMAKEIRPTATGDYYEFGLFRGYTLWAALEACHGLGLTRTHLYGFDSFEGLPAVVGIDRGNAGFFASQFACSKADATMEFMIPWHAIIGLGLIDEPNPKIGFKPETVTILE